MARPIYNGKITRSTDWGGDASTGNAPVSGARVQEYLKEEIVTLENKNTEQGEALTTHDTQISELQTNFTGLNQTVAQTVKDIGDAATAVEGLQEAVGGLQSAVTTQGAAIGSLQGRADTTESNITTMQGDVSNLQSGKADKSMFVVMSDTQYDALSEKDNDVFYYIYED